LIVEQVWCVLRVGCGPNPAHRINGGEPLNTIGKRIVAIAAFPLLAAALVTVGAPAQASGGGGAVQAAGTCSGGTTTWTLKAKPDDGQLEVEFEVDSNVADQVWNVKMTDNGTKIF